MHEVVLQFGMIYVTEDLGVRCIFVVHFYLKMLNNVLARVWLHA